MSPAKGPSPAFGAAAASKGAEKPRARNGDEEVLDVQEILRGKKRVNLLHRGEVYRLQVTKQGRLLLTK